MKNIIGISFTNKEVLLACLKEDAGKKQMIALEAFPYDFNFSYVHLLEEVNIKLMAGHITQFLTNHSIDMAKLNITLPNNFALTKTISLPDTTQGNSINEQVQWDLENFLPKSITQYKVIKKDIEFAHQNYKEILVICIERSIIKTIGNLALLSGCELNELWIDNFSLDNYLNSAGIMDIKTNQLVFKVNQVELTTNLFINGKYYNTYFDIYQDVDTDDFSQLVLSAMKTRHQQILNFLDHIPHSDKNSLQLFVHGDSLTAGLSEQINKDFTQDIVQLPVNHLAQYNGMQAGIVEILGVLDFDHNGGNE